MDGWILRNLAIFAHLNMYVYVFVYDYICVEMCRIGTERMAGGINIVNGEKLSVYKRIT